MCKTRAYKNLNNGKWSLKQRVGSKWVVVGHCDELNLVRVESHISDARHEYVRSGNHREVFAWLEGDLVGVRGFVPFRGREVVVSGEFDYAFDNDDLTRVTSILFLR